MIQLMEILRIYLEEQLLIKYYVIKHLILLNIENMVNIKEALLFILNITWVVTLKYGKGITTTKAL